MGQKLVDNDLYWGQFNLPSVTLSGIKGFIVYILPQPLNHTALLHSVTVWFSTVTNVKMQRTGHIV